MTQTTLREYLRTTEDAISSGRIDEAMANCQTILTHFPEALEAQRLLGEVYLAQGHLEEAQQTFEWILTNDPENVIVYCDRALISERTSDIDTALDCYQQAYELSRGNTNIRQEFNQLSARAGQQEFMLSRAGLARLYMRGDLLTQAIQEWEAVLAISPDRLDARLGLMETYWREGMYEKAEQIASQLLEEVPTCLKALLYLAHITSFSNMQRARDLLQRAAALDPDLVMAQEIFADLAASQPNDPFLQLIKREPILLENGLPINVQPINAPAPAPQPEQPAPSASPAYGNWEMLDNLEKPVQSGPSPISPLPDTTSYTDQKAGTANHFSSRERELSTWQPPSEQHPLASQQEQPWYQKDPFALENADALQNWNGLETSSSAQPAWGDEAQEDEAPPVPPAWLDTLTRSESQPLAAPAPQNPISPPPVSQPPVEAAVPEVRPAPEIKPAKQKEPEEEAMPFFFPSEDENDDEMGWPEWLKSLGAEALEPEQASPSEPLPDIDATPIKPAVEARPWEKPQSQPPSEADPWAALPAISANNDTWSTSNSQPDWLQQISPTESASTQGDTPDWMQQFASTQFHNEDQDSTPDWMQQLSGADQEPARTASAPLSLPADEQERHYVASLEDLEKSLQSQGFVPLAPGSLASIASTQSSAVTQSQGESSLSSALAQLGNISQSAQAGGEAQWSGAMMAAPQTGEQSAPAVPHTPSDSLNPFEALGARTREDTAPRASLSPLPATPTPMPPAQPPAPDAGQGTPLTPAFRSDALLDSDLETTMKRPAITLKPMQPGAAHNDQTYAGSRGLGERKPLELTSDSNLSNHERLVRGYQYQLSGAYEEAMQEYRLIIRNAPELLDDVISNLRALLKINPRFSLGYRVLGDAYMRKGEYLQAMESYNKALTMAKKARG
jgi:tetratricopeptide (TPR) repeat protein